VLRFELEVGRKHLLHTFLADVLERFAKFGLVLHPDKTRLIQFGRFACGRRSVMAVPYRDY
jgi:hypothetical protein